MKIYIAGTFARRDALRPIRDKLFMMGHEVISSWLDEINQPEFMDHATFFKKLAIKDISEVLSADLLICETGATISEGKSVELGVALGSFQNKLIYILGERRSVFHELGDKYFTCWENLISYMGATHAIHKKEQTT